MLVGSLHGCSRTHLEAAAKEDTRTIERPGGDDDAIRPNKRLVHCPIIPSHAPDHTNGLLPAGALLEHDPPNLEPIEDVHRDLARPLILCRRGIQMQKFIKERPFAAHLAASARFDVVRPPTTTTPNGTVRAALAMVCKRARDILGDALADVPESARALE